MVSPKSKRPVKVVTKVTSLNRTRPQPIDSAAFSVTDPVMQANIARPLPQSSVSKPFNGQMVRNPTTVLNAPRSHPTAVSLHAVPTAGSVGKTNVVGRVVKSQPPILIKSAVDDTQHAHPFGTPEINIERYNWRYENGQPLPDFAFTPQYDQARAHFSGIAFVPEDERLSGSTTGSDNSNWENVAGHCGMVVPQGRGMRALAQGWGC